MDTTSLLPGWPLSWAGSETDITSYFFMPRAPKKRHIRWRLKTWNSAREVRKWKEEGEEITKKYREIYCKLMPKKPKLQFICNRLSNNIVYEILVNTRSALNAVYI